MSFVAEFSKVLICGACQQWIEKGEEIESVLGEAVHAKCRDIPTEHEAEEITIQWATDISVRPDAESIHRAEMNALELAQIAPLQRPTCPHCFMELPASMICGSC
jgi:hypothetical protein